MERYDADTASRAQATHLPTAGCVGCDRRELAVTVLLHCPDRPYAASLRAMVPSWASGTPAQRQAKRVWQFLGGATLTFTFFAMIADSPFRQLAWGNFAYGGLLAVLPSVLLVALLAPLVSYRRRDVLLLLVPLWNLVTVWTIGSRIARLPYRDWPLRLDEIDRQTTQRGTG